jgi:hypothetical protein
MKFVLMMWLLDGQIVAVDSPEQECLAVERQVAAGKVTELETVAVGRMPIIAAFCLLKADLPPMGSIR